jgi:hypothetical protein
MRSTQQKFIELFTKAFGRPIFLAEPAKAPMVEVVHDPQYANTGRLRVQRPGAFDTLLEIRYDFQTGYQSLASAELWPGQVGCIGYATDNGTIWSKQVADKELGAVIERAVLIVAKKLAGGAA